MIKEVKEFPPNEFFKIRVNFESLKLTCFFFLPNYNITKPNFVREELILLASFSPSSLTPVLEFVSDPAKSATHKQLFVV